MACQSLRRACTERWRQNEDGASRSPRESGGGANPDNQIFFLVFSHIELYITYPPQSECLGAACGRRRHARPLHGHEQRHGLLDGRHGRGRQLPARLAHRRVELLGGRRRRARRARRARCAGFSARARVHHHGGHQCEALLGELASQLGLDRVVGAHCGRRSSRHRDDHLRRRRGAGRTSRAAAALLEARLVAAPDAACLADAATARFDVPAAVRILPPRLPERDRAR
eukprot:scaffold7828_cov70-Phaeocystis_antarctica.AAC.4